MGRDLRLPVGQGDPQQFPEARFFIRPRFIIIYNLIRCYSTLSLFYSDAYVARLILSTRDVASI
jgi:hypothetical protein